MEVEFVRGVRMKDQLAAECGEQAKKLDIALSIHAPYYINLCSDEEDKLENSRRHILESMHAGSFLHASPIVIHPGFYQGRTSAECAKRAKAQFQIILDEAQKAGCKNVLLGPELTGKNSAYGNLEEIVELSSYFGLGKMIPVIDFAHYHARTKRINNEADYRKILSFCEKELGSKFCKSFHCHFSGIEFGEKGERKHIPVSKNSPPLLAFLKVMKEGGYSGKVVCESPLLEKDTLLMKKEFEKL
jgi:deoxyribonuclease-4